MSVTAAYEARAAEYAALFDGVWRDDEEALVRRHLVGLDGPVLDLGCGPGHWSGHLHGLRARVTGVDLVPSFVEHARVAHPGPTYVLGSMLELDLPPVAGVLSWYSTIHLPPASFDDALAAFARLLRAGGRLVLGFFDSEDEVAPFDHAIGPAWRWPVHVVAKRLAAQGFSVVERLQHQVPERPDRRYAAVAAIKD